MRSEKRRVDQAYRSTYNNSELSYRTSKMNYSRSQFLNTKLKTNRGSSLPWIKKHKMNMSNLSFNPKNSELCIKKEDYGLYSTIFDEEDDNITPYDKLTGGYSVFTEPNIEKFQKDIKKILQDEENFDDLVFDAGDSEDEESKFALNDNNKELVPEKKYKFDFQKGQKVFFKISTKGYIFPAKLILGNTRGVFVTLVSYKNEKPTPNNCQFFSRKKAIDIKLRQINRSRAKAKVIENYWDQRKNPEFIYITIIPHTTFLSSIRVEFYGRQKKRKDKLKFVNKNKRSYIDTFNRIDYLGYFTSCRTKLVGLRRPRKMNQKLLNKNMLIARNFNTYTRRKRDLFNSLTERRSMNATVIRNQEQMKKKNRTMAVIRRKERQIQMRRDIVDHVLKEAIKRFRYRTWIVLINFVKTGEHVLKTVRASKKKRENALSKFCSVILMANTLRTIKKKYSKNVVFKDLVRTSSILKLTTGLRFENSFKRSGKLASDFFKTIPSKLRLLARFKRYHKACMFLVDGAEKFKELKMKYKVEFKIKWQKYCKRLGDIGQKTNYKPFEVFQSPVSPVPRPVFAELLEDVFFCETVRYLQTNISETLTTSNKYIFNLMIVEEYAQARTFYPYYQKACKIQKGNPLRYFLPKFEKKMKKLKKIGKENLLYVEASPDRKLHQMESGIELSQDKVDLEVQDFFVLSLALISHRVPQVVILSSESEPEEEQEEFLD